MKRLTLFVLLLTTILHSALANYKLEEFNGAIIIRQKGKEVPISKGMTLNANDMVDIAPGGSVKILNCATKEIFSSVGNGSRTVIGIMLDAKKKQKNTLGSINDRWRISKDNSQEEDTRLYTEGHVTRSMEMYDPEAENRQLAPAELALHIYGTLMGKTGSASCPTEVKSTHLDNGGLSFSVVNSLSHPVYLNILKINETGLDSVEISELGQPMGTYVLQPGQSITREQISGLLSSESHILVLTYCGFDIDQLIDETNKLLSNPPTKGANDNLPVYINRL